MPRLRWLFWSSIACLTQYGSAIGFFGIKGDYCSTRSPTCCPSRDDDCTVAILGNHLCYCDLFCDRGTRGNDCCPDFDYVCKDKARQMVEPTPQIIHPPPVQFHEQDMYEPLGCYNDGISYNEGESVKTNCNTCTCYQDQWSCESEVCLIQTRVLDQLENFGHTWRAKNYTKFWGRTLEDGVRYRLGTLFPEKSARNMNEVLIKPRELPLSFDAREKWPRYIHPVRDQGDCGSSWAFSTTATSADRLAIMSNGRINTALSPQQMLSCSQQKKSSCEGGHLDKAWWYIRKLGVVSETCYGYESGLTSKPGKCTIPRSAFYSGEPFECPSADGDATIYKMTPAYRISSRESDIMTEILTNGPVQATFLVYGDFFMYSSGVYQHIGSSNHVYQYTPKGYHSVRLIGWGIDNTSGREVKYWLAANSWGTDWGENGYFRIIRGENHCEIESFIIAAWGKGEQKWRKPKNHKSRREFRKF